jgi:formylglycine-generating enzyme required for sulfatase activity
VDSEGYGVGSIERAPEEAVPPDMIRIPGGTFRMGSEKHYPEEAPVHRVTVGGFWIDRTPVTNRQFKQFVHCRLAGVHAAASPGRSPLITGR